MASPDLRIVVAESDGFSPAAAERLRGLGDVAFADADRAGLAALVRDADVLWVRLRHRIDADLLAAAPRLRAIVSPTTGLNHIDLDEAARRGVAVLSLRGETEFLRTVRATAEHTVGLLLALVRRIPGAARHVSAGGWNRDAFRGGELYGKTAAVVGYGRLGRIVAGYLAAFGMRVAAVDPNVEAADVDPGTRLCALGEALAEADVVTLHVNLDATTTGLFGAERFAAMRAGALLVNTARGELLDEAALLSALEQGRLAGAALDVLADERSDGMGGRPLVEYARTHDNLIITPHIGGATRESMAKTEAFMAGRLAEFLHGSG
ncbi:MAG: hydroxyacid dehydrogenase [Armatimonadetes bacterium]|nr:hydroxyacid dehydrogenase [Armatimonadota bacterium]